MCSEAVAVYLGLGSNIGDRQDNLGKALSLLSQKMRIGQVSSVYDTESVGVINHPRFLNQVCQVYTTLTPKELLAMVKSLKPDWVGHWITLMPSTY